MEKFGQNDIQNNLKNSHIAIIGIGGQGSIIAQILVAMGIGKLTIVDGDTIERSNLTRQLAYNDSDIGKYKVEVLKSRLKLQNPYTKITPMRQYVTSKKDFMDIINGKDFVILCADKPLVKLGRWLNKVALSERIPYLGVSGNWIGPICIPFKTPCFECVLSHQINKDKDFEKYSIEKLDTYRELPIKAKEYYKFSFHNGKKPLLFQFVPHVLYNSSLNVEDLEIVEIE